MFKPRRICTYENTTYGGQRKRRRERHRERKGEREKTTEKFIVVRKVENRGEEKWSLII